MFCRTLKCSLCSAKPCKTSAVSVRRVDAAISGCPAWSCKIVDWNRAKPNRIRPPGSGEKRVKTIKPAQK